MGRAAALGGALLLGQAALSNGFITSLTSPVAAGAVKVGDPGTSSLEMYSLQDVDSDAVCNDGSPAAYFYSPGSGTGENIWLVYLEGSMFCFNQDSCNTRYKSKPFWMSSKSWTQQFAQGGIFSNDANESPFYNANLIYVKYCSSDLWSGDVGASDATFGYDFRGFRIITATITALIENHGMGSAPDSRLLFGGCSAGAIGAMNAIDVVAQMAPAGMKVQGLLDAAALVDINPDDNGYSWAGQLQTLQSLVADVMAVVNPQLPQSCLDLYPGESWKCMWGQYRLPLVQTPYFANAPQFDSFEIAYDTDNYSPSTPQQLAFVDSFQPAILSLINSMPPGTSVYSSTCFVHCISEQTTFYDLTTNGITMQQAVTEWFFGGEQVQVISPCQGWDCTEQCGFNSKGMPCNIESSDPGCVYYPGYTESATAPLGANQPKPAAPPSGSPKGGGSGGKKGQQQQQNNNNNNNGQQQNNNNQQQQQQVATSEPSLNQEQQGNMANFVNGQQITQQAGGRRRLRSAGGCASCGVDVELLKEGQHH